MSNFPLNHRVRFHLGAGKHYMHWQVRSSNGEVRFYDPETTRLQLWGCVLNRQPSAAKRIYLGVSHKTVCAWISCSDFTAYSIDDKTPPATIHLGNRLALRFNPHYNERWLLKQAGFGWRSIQDGTQFSHIAVIGRGLHPLCEDSEFQSEFFDYCIPIPRTEGVHRNVCVRPVQGR